MKLEIRIYRFWREELDDVEDLFGVNCSNPNIH